MVLAINIITMRTYLTYLYSLIICFSCSQNKNRPEPADISEKEIKNSITDTAFINGALIELVDNNGKSSIRVNSKIHFLSGNIKAIAPCRFLRRDGKVLSFSYPDIGVDHTIIVQGRGGIQGILFKKDSIICGDYITSSSPYNIEEGADEILYFDFAHRTYKNK
jgi:hypothetical protein